jgi:hypothetical protein
MARPLRLEFPGALYHLTARGDRREAIFEDDADRAALLDVFAHGLERFDAVCFAYRELWYQVLPFAWSRGAARNGLTRRHDRHAVELLEVE